MRFEWDFAKAAENLRGHGVSFEEATSVFFDPLSQTGRDPDHSVAEELVVAHSERGDRIRLISARPATRAERKLYEEG